jgi:hypothetical protein
VDPDSDRVYRGPGVALPWETPIEELAKRAVPRRAQQRRNKCPKTVCSFVALLKSERKIRRAIC